MTDWDFTAWGQAWSLGTEATIPSLWGPPLTTVLIPSVDPKLQDCVEGNERWDKEGRKGVSRAWLG